VPVRSERGFTLISVIIATVMLSIGLLALARTQTALVSTQASLQRRTAALGIAQAYLDEKRSGDLWTLASESAAPVDEHGVPAATGLYSRSTSVADVVAGKDEFIQLVVSVGYPGGRNPVQLVTLIYRKAS
jgi:Tfp pilus assembly protein PilV